METSYQNTDFSLKNIKIEQFAILENEFDANEKFSLATSFQIKINDKKQKIGIFMTFEIKHKDKIFLKLLLSCHFLVEESMWTSFLQQNSIQIPKDTMIHLLSVSFNTARGILFSKTEDTPYAKFILPNFAINSILDQDITFITD